MKQWKICIWKNLDYKVLLFFDGKAMNNMKSALIVVDMQNDFVTGSLGTRMAEIIVPNVVEKCKSVNPDETDIIFTQDTHHENYLQTREGIGLPIEHCIENTFGWQIIDPLKPFLDQKNVKVIKKPTFGSKDLVLLGSDPVDVSMYGLDTYHSIYKEYQLVGLCTDICVISNALLLKAFWPELKISVDSRCCAGTTKEAHDAALTVMQSCQIEVL